MATTWEWRARRSLRTTNSNMKPNLNLFRARTFCAVALGMGLLLRLAAAVENLTDGTPARASTAWSQFGEKAGADYHGDGLAVTPIAEGARLRCVFQRLEGEATREGLWLTSTVESNKRDRFRIVAAALGRSAAADRSDAGSTLGCAGRVELAEKLVRLVRPGLTEEYTVSMDGVRQDFLLTKRPEGSGELRVTLAAVGARFEPAAYGVRLLLENSGRKIAYSRLRVTDATGKELTARMEVVEQGARRLRGFNMAETAGVVESLDTAGLAILKRPEGRAPVLTVLVNDAGAVYPVRIDPTFSDANWISMNPSIPGASDYVYAAVLDASGNLYIGGEFTLVGDVIANRIAKWDGSRWSALGSGMNGHVQALAVSGNSVYAGGDFTAATNSDGTVVTVHSIARWDGSRWSALGSEMVGSVTALAVSGGEVYAGGFGIYKWDGTRWSKLDSGLGGGGGAVPSAMVSGLAVSESSLYAGGNFTTLTNSDGTVVTANSIARWDGSRWTALGSGINGTVRALAVSGGDLYVGGIFAMAGGSPANCVARWDGSRWSVVGSGVYNNGNFPTRVYALAVAGSEVYVGGYFAMATNSGGVVVEANSIAKWDGNSWTALGTGLAYDWYGGTVRALAVAGSNVYAGGWFSAAGSRTAKNIAKWDGSSWASVGSGSGMNNSVYGLALAGSDLYAGGTFTAAGDSAASCIAKWNGSNWTALGSGMNSAVLALAVAGSDVYAAGNFTMAGGLAAHYIAKWDGSSWSALGSGLSGGGVLALAMCGGDLYAGGNFNVAGGKSANGMAKWDGTNWTALGLGPSGGASWPSVSALAVSGGNVYAAGYFSTTGGSPVNDVAKWDGHSWTELGLGTNAYVNALAASGSNVYAAGVFTMAGGHAATNIAKWDGSSWTALGSGVNAYVSVLAVSGNDVYAAGAFTTAGGSPANYIAKWDGITWSALGSGIGGATPYVHALAVLGSDLYVGGAFTMAGGKVSAYIARAYLPTLPTLSVFRSGSDVTVSWPSVNTAGFALEQAGTLAAPADWVPNVATVSDDGTNKSVVLPATNRAQFFRLRGP